MALILVRKPTFVSEYLNANVFTTLADVSVLMYKMQKPVNWATRQSETKGGFFDLPSVVVFVLF